MTNAWIQVKTISAPRPPNSRTASAARKIRWRRSREAGGRAQREVRHAQRREAEGRRGGTATFPRRPPCTRRPSRGRKSSGPPREKRAAGRSRVTACRPACRGFRSFSRRTRPSRRRPPGRGIPRRSRRSGNGNSCRPAPRPGAAGRNRQAPFDPREEDPARGRERGEHRHVAGREARMALAGVEPLAGPAARGSSASTRVSIRPKRSLNAVFARKETGRTDRPKPVEIRPFVPPPLADAQVPGDPHRTSTGRGRPGGEGPGYRSCIREGGDRTRGSRRPRGRPARRGRRPPPRRSRTTTGRIRNACPARRFVRFSMTGRIIHSAGFSPLLPFWYAGCP